MPCHVVGRSWDRFSGAIATKKTRQPLSSFRGAETLAVMVVSLLNMTEEDQEDRPGILRSEDVVFAFDGPFAMEIILSDSPLVLSASPSRLNCVVHERATCIPIVTLEGFQLATMEFPTDRFPPTRQYEEGRNLFFGNAGRLE